MRSFRITCLTWCCVISAAAADLDDRLSAIAKRAPAGARVGVAVADCGSQRFIAQIRAEAAMIPASTMKLAISAIALERLGKDYQFSSRVVAVGGVRNGHVAELGVIGGGSPCLDEHFHDKQPDRAFAAWATQLTAAGVTHIDGDVVLDGRMFSGPIRPTTYPGGLANAMSWFSAPASALAWNDNCIEVRVVPGRVGKAAIVEVRPRSARIAVTNSTTTVSSGGDTKLSVSRAATSNAITVDGNYSRTTSWFPLAIHSDPDLLAGDHLAAILADSGITVTGRVRRGSVSATAGTLLIDQRDALMPALTIMNQRSQNFYGEQILRVMAAHAGRPGSVSEGTAVVSAGLESLLGANHGFTVLDGSGLSYGNRATAQGLVRLLLAMHTRHGALYADTLRPREVGTRTALVKTGSLAVALSLAGYVDLPNDGGRRAFSLIYNVTDGADLSWASSMRDAMLAEIAKP